MRTGANAMNFPDDPLGSDKHQSLKCDACGHWLTLSLENYGIETDGVTVDAEGLPVLGCPNCRANYLPDRSKAVILHQVDEAKQQGKPRVTVWRKPEFGQRRFEFCKDVEFLYDATDYDYLPGLQRPWDEGFLTPVFFHKSVLVKYMHHPSYVVELGSDSYGSIYKDQEHVTAFGINRNGKVVIWLGDLDQMELAEQHYLRSENVPSDHEIGSDFYLGQIEAVFTDYSKERRLFHLRMELAEKAFREFGLKLNSYEPEVIEVMAEVIRPVTWSVKEVRGVVEALNKVIVESLNNGGLRECITTLEPTTKFNGMKGLKLMQKWVDAAYGLDAATLMKPFFVLYDFRIVAAHLIAAESAEEKLASCHERMGIPEADRSLESLYDAVISGLIASYEELLKADQKTV
jgi:hypothetical protein